MLPSIESGSKQWHDRPPLRSDAARTQRQQLRDTISVALARLNALAPISYMPSEILATIFLVACDDRWSTSDRSTVVDISHVCRSWRIIAIQYPRLWAIPPLRLGCDWMKTFLSRSGSAPLAVETGYSEDSSRVLVQEMVQPIHEHLFHIQSFQITLKCDILNQLLSKLVTPAPTLQSVEIEAISYQEYTTLATIPRNIFGGDAPELRRLSLNSCIIPWDSRIFRNLASLHISQPSTHFRLFRYAKDGSLIPALTSLVLPTMSQLLGVLAACPLLRSLDLRQALPQASRPQSPHHGETLGPVHLSNLISVELLGVPHECERFLSHVIFPSSSNLTLNSWAGHEENENVQIELTALLNLLKNRASSSTGDFRSTSLWFCLGEGEIEIVIGNFNTRTLVPNPLDHGILTNFARQFFAVTPLADSVSLGIRFDDSPSLTREELMDIFAHDHLRCVDSVDWCGAGIGVSAFCAALWAYRETRSTNSTSSFGFPMFPHLKTIGFRRIDFSDLTIREILRAHLVALQEQRMARGFPIQKIKFACCLGLEEEWMDSIRVFDGPEIEAHL